MRMIKMTLFIARKLTRLFLAACVTPYIESAALIFSNMKVRHQEMPQAKKSKKSSDDPDTLFLT